MVKAKLFVITTCTFFTFLLKNTTILTNVAVLDKKLSKNLNNLKILKEIRGKLLY